MENFLTFEKEDDLDPVERVRLRSSSVASKSSGSNNSRKLRYLYAL